MLDVKMTDQMTGHETARHEIAGHETARYETGSEASNVKTASEMTSCVGMGR